MHRARIPQAGVNSQDPPYAPMTVIKQQMGRTANRRPTLFGIQYIRACQAATWRIFSTARLTRLEIGAIASLAILSIASVFFEP